MNSEYQKKINSAQGNRVAIKKFFDKLKKQKPADLDEQCNTLHDTAFEHIDCLQCANCCKTTGPLLLDKDIERLAKHLKQKPAEFSEKFLKVDEDRDYVFKNLPCPFLDSHNYCTVYDSRPNACREYPHTQQRKIINKLSITYHNAMICPAVAEVTEGLMKVYERK